MDNLYNEKLQQEWFAKGEDYATAINEMVAFAEQNGWDEWEGEDPEDKREQLAEEVFKLLKIANENNDVENFRNQFPPSHAPFVAMLDNKSQSIEQLCYIDKQRIVFLTGAPYQERQAYLLDDDKVIALDVSIIGIGKSKQGNVFAIANEGEINILKGWDGELINTLKLNKTAGVGLTQLLPFNDGSKIVVVTCEGIYLLDGNEEKLIHPLEDEADEEWTANIDMENATLSNDNQYIIVGDQCFDHRLLDAKGNSIGIIGPQSSYPHFCLFAKDDSQLITNSCHFYNGITIGINADKYDDINIEAYAESDDYVYIDEAMRVYAGLATTQYYILGDAYGYIKAFDKKGNKLWQHFLGSTISGMTVSDDEQTLWVGACSGILHKLQMNKAYRSRHEIGTANLYEECRWLIWKDEPQIWKW